MCMDWRAPHRVLSQAGGARQLALQTTVFRSQRLELYALTLKALPCSRKLGLGVVCPPGEEGSGRCDR
jgi:hypothetical protein